LYGKAQTDQWESSLYFEIQGKPKEVWIQFTDNDWELVRQKLEIEDDNVYMASIDLDNCLECWKAFQPYLISQDNVLVLYNKNKYLAYNDTWFALANIDESVQINANLWATLKYVKGVFRNVKKEFFSDEEIATWRRAGFKDAVSELYQDTKDTPEAWTEMVEKSAKIIVEFKVWVKKMDREIEKANERLWAAWDEVNEALDEFDLYKVHLSDYDVWYVESYFGSSTTMAAVWPGKLKWTKVVNRISENIRKKASKGKRIKDWKSYTNTEATQAADNIWYTKTRDYPFSSHWELVFKKWNNFITPDNTSHNYDYAWKVFNNKWKRLWTAVIENGNIVIKKN
jgi:hypothetical protein